MRLIDADALNDLISRQEAIAWVNNILDVIRYYHPHSKSRNVPIDNVIDALERVPSEDAVPVIRCKDCKYYQRGRFADDWLWCMMNHHYTDEDKYCAWAERKDE